MESDIKIRELINSSDAKISAAARRVFGTCLSEYSSAAESSCTMSYSHGFYSSSSEIPLDIDIHNAASAVVMLAPCKRQLSETTKMSKNGDTLVKKSGQSRCKSTPSSEKEGVSNIKDHIPVERLVRRYVFMYC